LNAAGVSIVRVSVATDLLDPTFDGRGRARSLPPVVGIQSEEVEAPRPAT